MQHQVVSRSYTTRYQTRMSFGSTTEKIGGCDERVRSGYSCHFGRGKKRFYLTSGNKYGSYLLEQLLVYTIHVDMWHLPVHRLQHLQHLQYQLRAAYLRSRRLGLPLRTTSMMGKPPACPLSRVRIAQRRRLWLSPAITLAARAPAAHIRLSAPRVIQATRVLAPGATDSIW